MKKSIGAKTIAYPTPVFLVGTFDAEGTPNLMTAAWAGICCSKPPCLAVSLREATYSYGSIVARQAFTVSIPSEDQVTAADYCGLASGRDADKFIATGFSAVASTLVDAPYVEEAGVVLECRLRQTLNLGLHTLFVGEIMDVKADEALLDDNGRPDVTKVRPLMADPGNWGYYGLGPYLGQAFSIGKQLR